MATTLGKITTNTRILVNVNDIPAGLIRTWLVSVLYCRSTDLGIKYPLVLSKVCNSVLPVLIFLQNTQWWLHVYKFIEFSWKLYSIHYMFCGIKESSKTHNSTLKTIHFCKTCFAKLKYMVATSFCLSNIEILKKNVHVFK